MPGFTFTNKVRRKREKIMPNLVNINGLELEIDRVMRKLKNATYLNGPQKQTFVSGSDCLELETVLTEDKEKMLEAWCCVKLNGDVLLSPSNYYEKKKEVIVFLENYFTDRELKLVGG